MSRWAALHAALSRQDRKRLLRRTVAYWLITCGTAGVMYWTPFVFDAWQGYWSRIEDTIRPLDVLFQTLGAVLLWLVCIGSFIGGAMAALALAASLVARDDGV